MFSASIASSDIMRVPFAPSNQQYANAFDVKNIRNMSSSLFLDAFLIGMHRRADCDAKGGTRAHRQDADA
jgi:hypothetical protein